MLTGDLLRARVVKTDLKPGFLKVDDRRLERAAALLELFTAAVARQATKGELAASARALEGTDPDHKVTKGLTKVLFDRCTFETVCPMEPADLRRQVFERAAQTGPLARRAGPTARRTAADVLEEVAAEVSHADGPPWTGAAVGDALYADLKLHQRVVKANLPSDAEALLHRYNVALVQSLLLKGLDLTVRLKAPEAKRVRQLLRWLKFHQLMFRVERIDKDLLLHIDGPQSLLRQSTRYGMQLATFFPAVLLQPGAWWLEARISWGRATKKGKRLQLDHTLGLKSHLRDTGTWVSRTERWFLERFEALDHGWRHRSGDLLDLGGQRVLVPDLTFEKDGRVGHLDIVGYWRRGYLERRLESTPPNVLLAVSKRLLGDKSGAKALPKALAARVLPFAEVIPAKAVLEHLEARAI